jgi:branched-chain amino acid transport system permease protein
LVEFIGNVVAGVADGAVMGLLAFAIVLLYKSTGVANFGEGVMATLSVFILYAVHKSVHDFGLALVIAVFAAMLMGLIVYCGMFRINDRTADTANLLMRTIVLFLLIPGVIDLLWSAGQPFSVQPVVPLTTAFSLAGVAISWLQVATVGVALLLAAIFAVLFRFTKVGLLYLGLADKPDVAELLGAPTRSLAAVAWMIAGLIGLIAGLAIVPNDLLTTGMTDNYLLYAFTAAIIGGLTSPFGAIVGGVLVGVVADVVSAYWGVDISIVAVFALILVTLLIRPQGIFGTASMERL